MKHRKQGACTTILVGKGASIDGSTLIARSEDGHEALLPQRFVVVNPSEQPRHYQAVISGCKVELPDDPMRYSSIPDAIGNQGVWAAAGINAENVGMTATETITTNPRILGLDPYVDEGLGEEDLVTLVLPYIHSAREGVERLGDLLTTYGTYEPNGIAFNDKDEIWWLETIGGHHWAAVRIPDDSYVVAPNRMNIDTFDFDSANTLCSSDLKALIDDNLLNPNFEGYNLRHIFGTSSIKDTLYNNPRVWYGQSYFGNVSNDPQNAELPFICQASRKITVEDVKFLISSHYEDTKYDPYGDAPEAGLFRPIGINRNHNTHIIQIRNNVPSELAGIHWLAFGPNTFNVAVPFYANVNDTPACYRDATATFDLNNMYWLSATTALLGDTDYAHYVDLRDTYELDTMSELRFIQNTTDAKGKNADLKAANEKMATVALKQQTELLGKMVTSGSKRMKLRYDFND